MCSDRALALLALTLLLGGCSVKENRSSCPCLLTLEMEGLPVSPVFLDVRGDGFSRTEAVHADTVLVLPVPKGDVSVSVAGGALAGADGAVRIPEGEEAPLGDTFRSLSTETDHPVNASLTNPEPSESRAGSTVTAVVACVTLVVMAAAGILILNSRKKASNSSVQNK